MIQSLRNRQFQPVYQQGKKTADFLLVMYVLERDTKVETASDEGSDAGFGVRSDIKSDENRVGITVSKKIGNSVVRSRVKRIIKEAYRLHQDEFKTGLDIVFVARKAAQDKKSTDMELSVCKLAGRLHALKDKQK